VATSPREACRAYAGVLERQGLLPGADGGVYLEVVETTMKPRPVFVVRIRAAGVLTARRLSRTEIDARIAQGLAHALRPDEPPPRMHTHTQPPTRSWTVGVLGDHGPGGSQAQVSVDAPTARAACLAFARENHAACTAPGAVVALFDKTPPTPHGYWVRRRPEGGFFIASRRK
jgi:hypothetical protein